MDLSTAAGICSSSTGLHCTHSPTHSPPNASRVLAAKAAPQWRICATYQKSASLWYPSSAHRRTISRLNRRMWTISRPIFREPLYDLRWQHPAREWTTLTPHSRTAGQPDYRYRIVRVSVLYECCCGKGSWRGEKSLKSNLYSEGELSNRGQKRTLVTDHDFSDISQSWPNSMESMSHRLLGSQLESICVVSASVKAGGRPAGLGLGSVADVA